MLETVGELYKKTEFTLYTDVNKAFYIYIYIYSLANSVLKLKKVFSIDHLDKSYACSHINDDTWLRILLYG